MYKFLYRQTQPSSQKIYLLSKTCHMFRLFQKPIISHNSKTFLPVPDSGSMEKSKLNIVSENIVVICGPLFFCVSVYFV